MQEDIYRIRVILDHPTEEVYRDIYTSINCSLEELKDVILKFFKLNRKMISSFYICNEQGDSEEEIVSSELGEDTGFRFLSEVKFSDIIAEKKNLVFAAHGIKVRFFHIEIFGKLSNASAWAGQLPKLEKSFGEIPRKKSTSGKE